MFVFVNTWNSDPDKTYQKCNL